MRHHIAGRKLSRTTEHRKALMRSLVTSLFEYERIETTVAKAKEARRVAERMITYAKRNNLHSRRLVARIVQNEDVAKKLFDTIMPWYTGREGGYTRILRTRRRLGDAGEMAILELVKTSEQKDADRKARAARIAAAEARKAEKKGREAASPEKEKDAEKSEAKPKAEAKTKPEVKAKPAPKSKPAAPRSEPHPSERKAGGFFSRFRRRKEEGKAGAEASEESGDAETGGEKE